MSSPSVGCFTPPDLRWRRSPAIRPRASYWTWAQRDDICRCAGCREWLPPENRRALTLSINHRRLDRHVCLHPDRPNADHFDGLGSGGSDAVRPHRPGHCSGALAGDPNEGTLAIKTNAVRGHCRSPRPFRVLAAHHRFLRLRVPSDLYCRPPPLDYQRSGHDGCLGHSARHRTREYRQIFAGIRGDPKKIISSPASIFADCHDRLPEIKETTELVFRRPKMWLGTVPITSALVAQTFGVRYLSTLFGFVFFSHQLGAFLGSWLGGYVFDLTGSYDIVWGVAALRGRVPSSPTRSMCLPPEWAADNGRTHTRNRYRYSLSLLRGTEWRHLLQSANALGRRWMTAQDRRLFAAAHRH